SSRPATPLRPDGNDVLAADQVFLDVEEIDALRIIALADLDAVEPEGELFVGRDIDAGLVHHPADVEGPAEIASLRRRFRGRIALVEPDPLHTSALLGLCFAPAGCQANQ